MQENQEQLDKWNKLVKEKLLGEKLTDEEFILLNSLIDESYIFENGELVKLPKIS